MNETTTRRGSLGLRGKLSVMILFVLAFALGLLGWLSFRSGGEEIRRLTSERLLAQTGAVAVHLRDTIQQARTRVLQTVGFPPVPGIVRCWDNDGTDPEQQGSDLETWKQRLVVILSSSMKLEDVFITASLVDETGHEVLRVESIGGQPRQVDSGLADLSATPRFVLTRELGVGDVHATPMALRRDSRGLVVPHQPIVYFCTPAHDTQGRFRAALMLGLDGRKLMRKSVARELRDLVQVADERGTYLYEGDQSLLFGPDLGHDANYGDDNGVRWRAIQDGNETFSDTIRAEDRADGVGMAGAYRKVHYDQQDLSRFWIVSTSMKTAEALASLTDLRDTLLWVGLLVLLGAAGLALLATGGTISAIQRLSMTANRIAAGDLDAQVPLFASGDEVGHLTNSFAAMTNNLREQMRRQAEVEEKTRCILDSTADAIITINEAGIVESFNGSAERLLGYGQGEVIGRNISMIMPSPYREEHDGYLARYRRTGEAHIIGHEREVVGLRKDGSTFPVMLRVSQAQLGDRRLFIGTVQDITSSRQEMEQQQQVLDGIEAAVAQLADSSQDLAASSSQQATSAQQQAASITETVATVEEVNVTTVQAVELANSVAENARSALETGQQGHRAVEESIRSIGTVKEQVESIAESILSLASQTQAIGEIIASVNELAEQTNLLALNAAIEASRAGEHGKGFQVVASEVKALADQSKKATAQVRKILGDVQQATGSAVLATEEGTRGAGNSIRIVGEAGDTIRSLVETLSRTADSAAQISASSSQTSAGMSQVQQAMTNISAATEQNVQSTTQVEAAAQILNQLGTRLSTLLVEVRTTESDQGPVVPPRR